MSKFGEIDLEGVKQAFDLFDQDGSGSISKEVRLDLCRKSTQFLRN